MVGSSPDRTIDDNTGSPSTPPDDLHPDDSAYEVDGWQRGFDVQFNGVGGRVEVRENDDDSSDWESDVSDDGMENRPAGYSALASEPPSQPTERSTTTRDDASRPEIIDQAPPANPTIPSISHMDEKTAESIRNAVASLKLPAPEWANKVSDSQLLEMITKMQEK